MFDIHLGIVNAVVQPLHCMQRAMSAVVLLCERHCTTSAATSLVAKACRDVDGVCSACCYVPALPDVLPTPCRRPGDPVSDRLDAEPQRARRLAADQLGPAWHRQQCARAAVGAQRRGGRHAVHRHQEQLGAGANVSGSSYATCVLGHGRLLDPSRWPVLHCKLLMFSRYERERNQAS